MRVLLVSLLVIIVDQVSKFMVKGFSLPLLKIDFHGLKIGQKIPLVGGLFNITFIENPGIAFGIYLGSIFKFLIVLFTLAASLGLLFYLYKNRQKKLIFRVSLALILGGAMGNLLDRVFYGIIYGYAPLFYGKVVDFFSLKVFDFIVFGRMFGSYVFNFADIAVTAGVLLLLYALDLKNKTFSKNDFSIDGILAENKE